MTHAVGLHARPSVKLTKLAKTFAAASSSARRRGGPWIDAKSIVKVMAAKAPQDSDAPFPRRRRRTPTDAVAALIALVERDFDEAPAGSRRPRACRHRLS